MILATDVDYRGTHAVAVGVLFNDWQDGDPADELVVEVSNVADYEPGRFYKREQPCLLQLLGRLDQSPKYIIIDGYVHLDRDRRPGLGRHLYDAVDGRSVVIGVAKSRFKGTPPDTAVFRHGSKRALYVTAAGIEESVARGLVARMHGEHRVPTMLRRVDRLSKTGR